MPSLKHAAFPDGSGLFNMIPLSGTSDMCTSPRPLDAVEKSICDWNNQTMVNWSYLGLDPTASTITTLADGKNLIFLGAINLFFGGIADATAHSVVSSRIKNCFDSTPTPNEVRFSYINEVDIVVREDLTTLNQPAVGWNFDYLTILGEEIKTTEKLLIID